MIIILKKGLKTNEYYEIQYDTENNKYYTCFYDGVKKYHKVEIKKEIADVYIDSWSNDKKIQHEFERHIEHSEIYEESLYKRAVDKHFNLEEYIIRKTTFEELNTAINLLPDIQKRRIKKYYFENKTEQQIAQEEGSTQQAVHIIIERAKENLKKILKNKI